MWPYSYDTCDLGTFPNQTNTDGSTPAAALTGSSSGGELSYLPGQRASACTCSGEDHPGPDVSVGRAAPEIDILEAQIDVDVEGMRGQVSQSLQVAPFNYQYQFDNASDVTTVTDDTLTSFNTYKGGLYQQAVSALTYIDDDVYGGENFATYAIEVWSNKDARDEGYIQWYSQGKESWKVTAGSVGADSTTEISERLIPEEPMVSPIDLFMCVVETESVFLDFPVYHLQLWSFACVFSPYITYRDPALTTLSFLVQRTSKHRIISTLRSRTRCISTTLGSISARTCLMGSPAIHRTTRRRITSTSAFLTFMCTDGDLTVLFLFCWSVWVELSVVATRTRTITRT